MRSLNWLPRWFLKRATASCQHPIRMQRNRRPSLEVLEDRTVPTAVSPPDGLVSWWTGDGTAADFAGYNHGTLTNGATTSTGQVANGFSFDGVDDIFVASSAGLPIGNAERTVELWAKVDQQVSGAALFASYGDPDSVEGEFTVGAWSDGRLFFSAGSPTIFGPVLQNDQWYHVAVTSQPAGSKSLVKLYLDGTEVASDTVDLTTPAGWDFTMGRLPSYVFPPGDFYRLDGMVDEVSVYDRSLSPAEVQSIYDAGPDGKLKLMAVKGSVPGANGVVTAAPTDFTLDFTYPYEGSSVQADGLLVNGVAADTVTLTDADTLTFHYNTSPVTTEGLQTVFLSGGAVQASGTGEGVAAATWSFRYDLVPLEAVATTPDSGTVVPDSGTTVQFAFNEAIDPMSVGTDDLTIGQGMVTGASLSNGNTVVTYTVSGLSEGVLSVALEAGAVTDTHGNPLSGNYSAVYEADIDAATYPGQLTPRGPVGSLIYQGIATGQFNTRSLTIVPSGSGGLKLTEKVLYHDGYLFVVSRRSNSILRYDAATGAARPSAGNTGAVFAWGNALNEPLDIAFGPDDNLYVTSYKNSVIRFDGATGTGLGTFVASGSGGLSGATGLTFGPDGHLYVASRDNDRVLRYDGTTGAPLPSTGNSGATFAQGGGLDGPDGLVFGPDGRLYVSSQLSDEVIRYEANGGSPSVFISAGSGGIDQPLGLRFGPDGNLYVVSYANSQVLRYQGSSGAYLNDYVSSHGGGLSGPTGLDFGPDGELYVSSRGTSSVVRFDGAPTGSDDIDSFTLDLDGNQTLTLRVSSAAQPVISLTHSVLGAITLPTDQDPGAGLLYQTIALPVAGTLTIGIQEPVGLVAGAYTIEVTLNALLDQSSAAAPVVQSLDGATLDLDPGTGTFQRAAALGTVEKGTPRIDTETEGQVNDLRGSWDRVGSTSTWTINQTGNATTPLNKGVTGSLTRKGKQTDDSDSWQFDAHAGDTITLRGHGSNSNGGTLSPVLLDLYGPIGNLIASGASVPGASSDRRISNFTLAQTGSYTVVVSTSNGKKGTYTLTADLTTSVDPRYLPDDIYTFSVAAPGHLSLAASTASNAPVGASRVQVSLFAPGGDPFTGSALATSATSNALDAWLDINVTSAGVYTIKVSPGPGLTGSSVNYSLVATAGGVVGNTANEDFTSAQDITGRNMVLAGARPIPSVFVPSGIGGLDYNENLLFRDGKLYVVSRATNEILRYDAATGAFLDVFVSGVGVNDPIGLTFGADGNLYLGNYNGGDGYVARFDGASGAFLGTFVASGSGGLSGATGLTFGPDGHLYVASRDNDRVLRYDGTTGAPLPSAGNSGATFAQGGGLDGPNDILFGPDGNLYVPSQFTDTVLRYDGTTGAFLDTFVSAGSGGLGQPLVAAFGPDGYLYVTSFRNSRVLRFEGVTGSNPGAFVDTYLASGAAGLTQPTGLAFDSDGNLYVSSRGNDRVVRVRTGPDFYRIDLVAGQQLVVTSRTPLDGPGQPVNRLDPVLELYDSSSQLLSSGLTLADGRNEEITYTTLVGGTYYLKVGRSDQEEGDYALRVVSGSPLIAASRPAEGQVAGALQEGEVASSLAEAFARWAATGADVSLLNGLAVRIADLGGTTLALAADHTIWLDDDAAGWGWFVDPTPSDDSEFLLPGDQGEQGRMDLLTVLMHEMGHILGFEHEESGVMQQTLAPGTRPFVDAEEESASAGWLGMLDHLFAQEPNHPWIAASPHSRPRQRADF